MKNNQEILDEFGKKIIDECFDGIINHYESIKQKKELPIIYKTKKDFLDSLSTKEYQLFKKNILEIVNISFFEFFNILEENEQFKLIYEENGKQVNLVKISEMLKAEPLGENGWIKRFSKYADEYEE